MTDAPSSSYSFLVIHFSWKAGEEARLEPPIHAEYCRSDGATILMSVPVGASAATSVFMRAAIPRKKVAAAVELNLLWEKSQIFYLGKWWHHRTEQCY